MPLTFTPWRNKVEKQTEVRSPDGAPASGSIPLPEDLTALGAPLCSVDFLPSLEDLGFGAGATVTPDPRGVMPFHGGETAARQRLQGWMWDRDCLKDYFNTRNGMLGADYSTNFAPWLATGCLSPRRIYAECKRYESQRVENKSTYWVVFELIWRDFFRYMGLKVGD